MTDEKYAEANRTLGQIERIEELLDRLGLREKNPYGLPPEMAQRHHDEARDYLNSELARLRAEFAAL